MTAASRFFKNTSEIKSINRVIQVNTCTSLSDIFSSDGKEVESVTLSAYHVKPLEMTTNGPLKQGLQSWTLGYGGDSYDIYVVTTI